MPKKHIKWEHFQTNLIPDNEIDDIDDLLDEDEKGFFDSEFATQEKMLDLSNKFDFTPFGNFLKKDPLSPYNLYDNIWVANLCGFNVHDDNLLATKLDSTKGVAVWRQQDPHMLIFAFARGYDPSEVRRNLEISILGESQINQSDMVSELLNYSKSEERDHVISIFPNGNTETIFDNVEESHLELQELKKKIKDLIIIRNGQEV